jgi:hypothetical protein
MKEFQIINKAKQIKRIKTALMFPSGEIGTFYSNPFRIKMPVYGFGCGIGKVVRKF